MRNMVTSLRWGIAAAGIHVAFLAVFLLSACTDVGDRDNPLDPGASNYVAQFDTVQEIVQMSEDEALSQLIEDIKNGKVDTSDGLSQSLIDSIKSGAITADDLKKDSSLSSEDSKIIDSLAQKTIEDSRDTIEVVVPVSSSQKSESSSSKKGSSSSSVSSSESPEVVSSSSENVESSSSVFSIDIYLNPNISYGEITDDRDGQVYKTVNINGRVWMAQNLNFETENSYCLNDKMDNCTKFGRLYTWGAAMDSAGNFSDKGKGCGNRVLCEAPPAYEMIRGVCPEGFHLPSAVELGEIVSITGGDIMKAKSTKTWKNAGTDDFGFSVVQAGRLANGNDGYQPWEAFMWSNSQVSKYAANDLTMVEAEGWGPLIEVREDSKSEAYSVRCVQDYEVFGSLTDDRDGQTYKTIKIGSQNWMAENLNYAYLQPTTTEDSSSFCLDNKAENCNKYGRLYLWSAAMDSAALYSETGKDCGDKEECFPPSYPVRGVCPKGWHLPTIDEFVLLGSGGGYVLKSKTAWHDGKNGSDAYGFNAYPAGGKGYVGDECTDALGYDDCDNSANYWTSEEQDYASAQRFGIGEDDDNEPKFTTSEYKWYALSVRCVENAKSE
ncbi:FISUMP domain-containing protein [Fibrobacter sp.]|uniref:FISUMP domain-containing protein n=1 Tax=Fibrobacter sp. TaxID=35828 RepID=UPI003865E2D4